MYQISTVACCKMRTGGLNKDYFLGSEKGKAGKADPEDQGRNVVPTESRAGTLAWWRL